MRPPITAILLIALIIFATLTGCQALAQAMLGTPGITGNSSAPPAGYDKDPAEDQVKSTLTAALTPVLGPLAGIVALIIITIMYRLGMLKYVKIAETQMKAIDFLKINPELGAGEAVNWATGGNEKLLLQMEKLYQAYKAANAMAIRKQDKGMIPVYPVADPAPGNQEIQA